LSAKALLVVGALLLIAVPSARADGDPASDYLLGQTSFIPPDAAVPSGYAHQLSTTLTEAKSSGFTIRVALIASRYDMGSVGVLFRQPERYARFLGQELYFVYSGRLLVVMPNGLGVSHGGKAVPSEQRIAAQLPAPGTTGVALAATATKAVVQLAAGAGVVIAVPPLAGTTASPNQNHDRIVIVVAVLVALAAFGGFFFLRVRFGGPRRGSP
jgi:hypothetical protein